MQEKIQQISPIKQRILQYAENLGISKREFYAKIGVSRGTLEAKTGITEDVLAKFIAVYPEISLDWLIKGEGPMLKGPALPYDPDKELLDMCGLLLEVNRQKENVMSMIEKLVKLSNPDK